MATATTVPKRVKRNTEPPPGKQQVLLACWLRRHTIEQLLLLWDEIKGQKDLQIKSIKREEIVFEIVRVHATRGLHLPRAIR